MGQIGGRYILQFTVQRTSSALYDAFTHPRVVDFAARNEFVNAKFTTFGDGFVNVVITQHSIPNWSKPSWSQLQCTETARNIKTMCTYPNSDPQLVFYRNAQDLREYILKLTAREIGRHEHIELWNVILDTFPYNFVNHNMSVATLHFKN